MANRPKIAPSILTADFGNLGAQVEEADQAGVDLIHLDVMDGNFVPNISFGPSIIEAVNRHTDLELDVHLMVSEPERYILDYAKAGADYITIHFEATIHPHRALQMIRDQGVKAGMVINPGTPLSAFEPVLEELDLALLMSVNPGFGGQSYIPATTKRLEKLREMRDAVNPKCVLEIDGGVKAHNIKMIGDAGADIVVVGSAIYNGKPVKENLDALHKEF